VLRLASGERVRHSISLQAGEGGSAVPPPKESKRTKKCKPVKEQQSKPSKEAKRKQPSAKSKQEDRVPAALMGGMAQRLMQVTEADW
jgi:hypothetical protein